MNDKQMIAAGTPSWLAISPQYSDEQVEEYVKEFYGWESVTIKRQEHLVLVQPKGNGDNHDAA